MTIDNKILKGLELKEFGKQLYKKVSDDLAKEIGSLGTASKVNTGLAEGNIPVLGAEGKLNPSVLPAVAVDTLVIVQTKDEALLADVQNGDFVRVISDAKVYMVIDDTKKTSFNEMFVPLSSVTDAITRAELQTMLNEKVDKTTYGQDKTELEGKINGKVTQSVYDAKVLELESGIASKVSTDAYTLDKSALETKIASKVSQDIYDSKVSALEGEIAKKVNSLDYVSDLAELNVSINSKVAQSVYDLKIGEIEGNIAKKLNADTYTSDKTILEGKVNSKATSMIVEGNALKLKSTDGAVLSSIDFITSADITEIINALA